MQVNSGHLVDDGSSRQHLAGACMVYVTNLAEYERARESCNMLALHEMLVGGSHSRVAGEGIV